MPKESISPRQIGAGVLVGLASSAALVMVQAGKEAPEPGWAVSGVVTDVHDGDTITVAVTTKYRVRLLDAWAPETRIDGRLPEKKQGVEKEAGLESRDHLKKIALGKEVVLHIPIGEDLLKSTTMGRVLGTVWVQGSKKSLNAIQVELGYATREKRDELK